jgi:serine/threonine protein kinase/tetratricopeptide (TPR) repeat protein
MSTSSSFRDYGRFFELASEFSERYRRGDRPSLEEYVDRLPEMADEIREMFPALVEVEQVKAEARVEALRAVQGQAGPVLDPEATGALEPTPSEALPATQTSASETRPASQAPATVAGVGTAEATGVQTQSGTIEEAATADATGVSGQDATMDGPSNIADDTRHGVSIPGRVIAGRYTLRDVLGEGGMGTVYRADQFEPVRRQVALKLIKIGMDSRAVLARFDAERQALALMDHPNIARVYDGGTTEAGQPFFVMELVAGEPITEYCDRKRLRVQARLELFVAVCQAVQHAHQKGIIHRDLKPSNVMVIEVDGRPMPKVIDFGVAKATEFNLTDQSLADTGAIVGTPTYMSPEQADPSSMDIDTRTDVYALGVILYELLAGAPPLDAGQFKRGAILEMLRMVREVDPPRPSTKVSTAEDLPNIAATRDVEPEQLKRALRGDLDWIVMKALEKDRTRRYETANGFAADVLRHLAHEPVMAAPPSGIYRLRKFVRKHRAAVIAATLVVVSLLGGLGAVAAVQTAANASLAESLRRETEAKNNLNIANNDLNIANSDLTRSRAAVQERYDLAAEAIKTFHTGVSQDFLLKEDKFKHLRNTLLTSASDFYGKLGALLGKETDFASRRALAQANFELAQLTDKVGRSDDALAAHRQVLAARGALAAEPGADIEAKLDVGRSLATIAQLLRLTGKTAEAEAAYRKAQALLAELALSSTSTAAVQMVLAITTNDFGQLLLQSGRLTEAEAEYRKALALCQKLADDNPSVTEFRVSLSRTMVPLATLLGQSGRRAESFTVIKAAIAILQKAVDDNPASTDFRYLLAISHMNLGNGLVEEGKLSEAVAEQRTARRLWQQLTDDNPAVTRFRYGLAHTHMNLGSALGENKEAQAECRAAIAVLESLAHDNPAEIEYRYTLARSYLNLGTYLVDAGKPVEAEPEYRNALRISQKLADDHPEAPQFRSLLQTSRRGLGDVLSAAGKPASAEAEYRKALALGQQLADENPRYLEYRSELAANNRDLAEVVRKLGRPAEALAGFDRAIALLEQVIKESPAQTEFRLRLASSFRGRGLSRRDLRDPAGAAADARRALSLLSGLPSASGQQWFETACCHAVLAGLAGNAGSAVSAAEAKTEADQAMALLRRAVDADFHYDFRNDSALDPLRTREDFKKLIDELEKPPPARPEKKP